MGKGKSGARPHAGLLKDPRHFLALGFGSGLAPIAPGTFGTLAAIPLYLLLRDLPVTAYLGVLTALFLAGIWLCGFAAHKMGVHDHPGIVWDEVVGYLATMILAPSGWLWVALGFVFFRLFDILKPWPVRWADQRAGGGFGIMLDDLLAAGYAWLSLQAVQWLMVLYNGVPGDV